MLSVQKIKYNWTLFYVETTFERLSYNKLDYYNFTKSNLIFKNG